MKPDVPSPSPWAYPATALAYAIAGWLALSLAMAPSFATPFYPAAGIALVALLTGGRRLWVAVLVGSLLAQLGQGLARGVIELRSPWIALAIAGAAALQAVAAAANVRRTFTEPLTLTEPKDLLRFALHGAMLPCLVSATLSSAVLGYTGVIALPHLLASWATWWAGDTLGVLIAAPIALSLVGRPASAWLPRRRVVAAPLMIVTLLVCLAITQAKRWDDERMDAIFERDAANVLGAVRQRLQLSLDSLRAMQALYLAVGDVPAEAFARATRPWTEHPDSPFALGWIERVPGGDVATFEAQVRSTGLQDYNVFDRDADGSRRAPAPGSDVMAIRMISPMVRNAAALGVNVLSIPEAARAIESTRRTGVAAATPAFRLTQETADQAGVAIYQAVFRESDAPVSTRDELYRGAVMVSLRMDDTLGATLSSQPSHLRSCLVDTDPAALRRRLAGPVGCEQPRAAMFRRGLPLEFAQRRWELQVSASDSAAEALGHRDTWLFSFASLLGTATFGALLLTMTGRTQRIEAAVDERTAALQREIVERARTESALRDSEQRFRNILNHVPIGVLYTDLQGHIKQTNAKFRELVGYSVEELAPLRALEFTHPEDRTEDVELTQRLVQGKVTVYQRNKRFLRVNGDVLWVRAIVSLLRDAQGSPHRIVAVVEDITEHLMLQEAQAARETAEAANRAKNDFLSRMSHELRTPLNAMLGFAQLIELDRQQALSLSQREWVGQIQTAGWHLLEMINDTLDLSRIESGTLKLDVASLDLPQLVASTISMIERAAQARSLILTTALSPEAAQINGDATRVKQVLTNLLTNAVKYNVDGGRIHIATRVGPRGTVEIAVSDTGLGMSDTQLAGLFQPFNRLGRERSSQEGTGIGLVISQRLAELMGGGLYVRSTEGEGSVFVLTLPMASRERAGQSTASDALVPHEYRQRVVHYIEDNETNAVVMEGVLAQRPQVRLMVYATGLDGLAAIRLRPPSLILLDMHLPDIDGLQLLRMLKDDDATASIPVVVVSADAVASRIQAALDAGAEHYLTKPVNVNELLDVLDTLLEQRDTLFG